MAGIEVKEALDCRQQLWKLVWPICRGYDAEGSGGCGAKAPLWEGQHLKEGLSYGRLVLRLDRPASLEANKGLVQR